MTGQGLGASARTVRFESLMLVQRACRCRRASLSREGSTGATWWVLLVCVFSLDVHTRGTRDNGHAKDMCGASRGLPRSSRQSFGSLTWVRDSVETSAVVLLQTTWCYRGSELVDMSAGRPYCCKVHSGLVNWFEFLGRSQLDVYRAIGRIEHGLRSSVLDSATFLFEGLFARTETEEGRSLGVCFRASAQAQRWQRFGSRGLFLRIERAIHGCPRKPPGDGRNR